MRAPQSCTEPSQTCKQKLLRDSYGTSVSAGQWVGRTAGKCRRSKVATVVVAVNLGQGSPAALCAAGGAGRKETRGWHASG